MNLVELLQIIVVILLLFYPSILIASIIRLAPIYRLSQKNASMRSAIILVSGLVCLVITFALLAWVSSAMLYSIAQFYFDATFGLVPGITRADVEQYNFAAINEMWLRQIVPGQLGPACFNGNATICQLADAAAKVGSLDSMAIVLMGLALVPTFLNLFLSWRFTRPHTPVKPQADSG
jgi:hypothetical protein